MANGPRPFKNEIPSAGMSPVGAKLVPGHGTDVHHRLLQPAAAQEEAGEKASCTRSSASWAHRTFRAKYARSCR